MEPTAGSASCPYTQVGTKQCAAVAAELDKEQAAAPNSGSGRHADADTVEISGRSVMVSRIFRAVPESVYYAAGNGPATGSIYNYLTPSDRDTMAGLYDYARDNNVDPRRVDAVAFDLAIYRSEPPGVVHPTPVRYDENGVARPAAFSAQDESAARRILTSKAISTCALPEDFLRARLDPALSEGHAADLSFLEQIVYATSPDGSATDATAQIPPRPGVYFAKLEATGQLPRPGQIQTGEAIADSFARDTDRIPAALGSVLPEVVYQATGVRLDKNAKIFSLLAVELGTDRASRALLAGQDVSTQYLIQMLEKYSGEEYASSLGAQSKSTIAYLARRAARIDLRT